VRKKARAAKNALEKKAEQMKSFEENRAELTKEKESL